MGVFGFAEIMTNLELKDKRVEISDKVGSLYPNRRELREAAPAILRGTALGSCLGILPGGGATLSAFASYTLEKKVSREPEGVSARDIRPAWPGRNPPITRARRPRSSRC